jgi:hypothetical protein
MLLPSIVMAVISDAEAVLARSVFAAATADPVIAMLRNSLRVFISSSLLSGVDSSFEKSSDFSVSSKLHGSAKQTITSLWGLHLGSSAKAEPYVQFLIA